MPLRKFAKFSPEYRQLVCNGVTIKVAIANTHETRQKGLAGVTDLPEDYGMLFDFGSDQSMSFWMKNCLQDLSIAFITKHGVIVDIQEMSAKNPTKLYHSPIPVKYALEVNPGFFTRHNIVPGDKISF